MYKILFKSLAIILFGMSNAYSSNNYWLTNSAETILKEKKYLKLMSGITLLDIGIVVHEKDASNKELLKGQTAVKRKILLTQSKDGSVQVGVFGDFWETINTFEGAQLLYNNLVGRYGKAKHIPVKNPDGEWRTKKYSKKKYRYKKLDAFEFKHNKLVTSCKLSKFTYFDPDYSYYSASCLYSLE